MCKTMENSSESVNTFDKAKNSASGLLSRSVTSAKATLKSRIPIVKTKKQEESSTCRVSTKDKKTVDLKIEPVMCKTMENSSESVNTFDKAKNSASGLLSRSVTSAKATLKSRIPIVKTKKQEESSTCRVSTKDKKTVDLKIEPVMCKTMENSSESVNTFDKAKNSASGLLSRSVTSAKATLKSRIPIVKTKKQEESSTCRVSTKDKKTVDLKIESVKGASTVQNNFVKSSDMKKMLSKLFFQERVSAQDRMSRSIPEMSWFDMKVLSGSANGRSLSRIFPCLTASVLSRTSSDADFTTASISSIGTQNTDSNLATSLGADLLRMFLEEIGTDVVIEVAGRRIRAHECILSSRCVFFAGELSGERDESAGNNCIISLPGFSYEIVHFVIYNIYSGVNTIPDNIDMTELCRFTHHISLQGLNDAIEFKLKSEYCHFFHEPCVECSSRALECLMLAEQYELDEIYRESIQWINKHYIKIWTHEPFLSISSSLLHKLLIHHLHNQLNVDNIRDTLMNCDKMLSKMRGFRWEKVVDIVRKLRDGTIKYASENVSSLLNDDSWFELDGDLRQKILMLSTNTKPTNLNARMKCTPWKQSFDEKVIPMAPIQLLQHKELVKKLQYNQGNARN